MWNALGRSAYSQEYLPTIVNWKLEKITWLIMKDSGVTISKLTAISYLDQKQFMWMVSSTTLKLNSSTIDELREWCLNRRVGPGIKPSQMCSRIMTTLWAAATPPSSPPPRAVTLASGNTNACHDKWEGRGGNKGRVQTTRQQLTERKWLDIRSRAVSHVGPLHGTPGRPTPKPWEIQLASIVSRLT